MKKIYTGIFIFVFSLFAASAVLVSPVLALDPGLSYGATTGLGERDPREIAASIINVALGFLGIVAVIIILLGGFKWMTAAGNEDKVEEAKKLIVAGIVGLLIILASYAIATFVINSLLDATGA